MKTIWKFALVGDPWLSIHLPEGSRPVAARRQLPPYGDGGIQVWILIDTSMTGIEDKQKLFEFFAFSTGENVSPVDRLKHLATLENPKTGIIQHVFWRAS